MRAFLPVLVVVASASLAHAEQVAPAPVAVEIVLQGTEISMGNDDIESEDSAARYPGMLKALAAGLQAAPLMRVLPDGSVIGLVTYADAAEIKWPLRDGSMISPAVLGTQKDYYMKFGSALVEGVDQGMAELVATRAERKFLVVIGDGNSTNDESAKPAFAAMRARAIENGIEPIVVIYQNALSNPSNVIVAFAAQAQTVNSADGIVSSVERQLAYALAEGPRHATPPVIVAQPTCTTSWFTHWRWQLAIGSVLALIAMGGVWFVRRERL